MWREVCDSFWGQEHILVTITIPYHSAQLCFLLKQRAQMINISHSDTYNCHSLHWLMRAQISMYSSLLFITLPLYSYIGQWHTGTVQHFSTLHAMMLHGQLHQQAYVRVFHMLLVISNSNKQYHLGTITCRSMQIADPQVTSAWPTHTEQCSGASGCAQQQVHMKLFYWACAW